VTAGAPPAIDAWVNVNMAELGRPPWLVAVEQDTFQRGDAFFRNDSIDAIVEQMDRLGVERAILTTDAERPSPHVLSFPRARPDRFALGVHVDPRRVGHATRALASIARDEPVVCARITPFYFDLPPTDRVYYPVYAHCVAFDLPLTINTGMPAPPVPGACQHPLHLDRVCLDFPELVLVMAHGADPWWQIAIRLMLKYRNLHLMTSAWAPKHLPPELIHFLNTRGRDKVIFASDQPAVSMERALGEARALELRPGVLERFTRENARRVFFDRESRRR
jgi:predicted TIM-barrel fold metal-dependent hydrolase